MYLRKALDKENDIAMEIINDAKEFLKQQGIDQWQKGYPDKPTIDKDIKDENGYFIITDDIIGYVCIDYRGELAYQTLQGTWNSNQEYAVVHRLALKISSRGKNISTTVFQLIENQCIQKGVKYIRIDTDDANEKMKKLLARNGYVYCGTVTFDNSEKIAFDKML